MSTGIGNLYKAEVLFLRGINPWQPVGRVADLGAVTELARRLLEANKDRVGQVTTGNWRRGEETWVYGRRGRRLAARCRIRSAGKRPQAADRYTRLARFGCAVGPDACRGGNTAL